jgi:hypothetical protein
MIILNPTLRVAISRNFFATLDASKFIFILWWDAASSSCQTHSKHNFKFEWPWAREISLQTHTKLPKNSKFCY